MDDLNVNDYLKSHIRTVPDWPAAGVQFRDITPLLPEIRWCLAMPGVCNRSWPQAWPAPARW